MITQLTLPKSYERCLDVWSEHIPLAATRARGLLPVLMQAVLNSPVKNALNCSALTRTGSAFEPAFSLSKAGLRYTVCPCPPELAFRESLDYCLNLLKSLDVSLPENAILDRLRLIQAQGELKYGAQIGVRHTDTTDAYKLYVEVPAAAANLAEQFTAKFLSKAPVLNVPERNATPTLIGIDLQTFTTEVYYRVENLHPAEISTLLSRIDCEHRATELLEVIEKTQMFSIKHELPGNVWGFSYTKDSNDDFVFSLYTFSDTLFGPDNKARAILKELGLKYNWDLKSYLAMSKGLNTSEYSNAHHGIFGLVLPSNKPPMPWIGLAPV